MSRRFAVFFALALLGMSAVPSLADAKRRALGSRTLVEGMRGSDVRVLQSYLSRAGFRVKADGEFGPRTSKRVRAWESAAELPVDAKVTRPDSRRLRSEVESGGASYRSAPAATESDDGPIEKATIAADGTAVAPASAPEAVKAIIAAGNEIHDKPYRYGGGHGDWTDSGYDCSGSVSYALHFAGLLRHSMPSGGFMDWRRPGKGRWVTTYAHGGHMYMVVAGLRFDTSGAEQRGSRWTTEMRSSSGFVARHPGGL